jgi:hypothetical protein
MGRLAAVTLRRTRHDGDADRLDALESEVASLRQIVAELVVARAPRDEQDRRLRAQLAASTKGLQFSASELIAHARVDRELARALKAADVETPVDAGCWLRSNRGSRDGIAIIRRRRRWQVITSVHDVPGVNSIDH